MKLFGHIESGFYRALKAWKGVLFAWIASFLLASSVSVPLKGALNAAFGQSMIVENLANGIDPEVFTDLGKTFGSIMSLISSGMLYVLVIGFIINAFLAGGLFSSVRKKNSSFLSAEFFRACASDFWSFFMIGLATTLMIVFAAVILAVAAFVILQSSETRSELSVLIIGGGAIILFLLILPVFLLAADYGRAWRSANGKVSFMKSLGSGFRLTFEQFGSSWFLMFFMILIQVILILLTLRFLPSWHPGTSLSMIALFAVTQFTVFAGILFRTWRYAGVTSKMEDIRESHYAITDLV
jgi:hypothetical protein